MLLSQRLEDELDRLEALPFSFDMDNSDKPASSSKSTASGSRSRRRSRSVAESDAPDAAATNVPTSSANYPTLDPFALINTPHQAVGPNTGFFPGQLPGSPHAVNPAAMQIPGGNPYAAFPTAQPLPPQYQSHINMWPFTPQQFASNVPLTGGPPGFLNNRPQEQFPYPAFEAGSSRPTRQHTSPVPSTSQARSPTASSQEQVPADPEEAAILEDKRRRNTAASARFRIKKKQKSLNLERTVSDLTSRAEELEREATNLRRENSWLKEMVIMKGRGNMAESRRSRGKEATSNSEENSEGSSEGETSEDSDTDGEEKKGKGKGKGKAKAKAKDKGKGKKGKK